MEVHKEETEDKVPVKMARIAEVTARIKTKADITSSTGSRSNSSQDRLQLGMEDSRVDRKKHKEANRVDKTDNRMVLEMRFAVGAENSRTHQHPVITAASV